MNHTTRLTGILGLVLGLVVPTAHAQWIPEGVPVCLMPGAQASAVAISDGAGGAFVTWHDARAGGFDIYAQRISATGAALWTPNGVALCTAANTQQVPMIASDGVGGAIVTWSDFRIGGADIYAQRVNAMGVVQWVANGVGVCTVAGSNQLSAVIVADGASGAVISWEDGRSGSNDIYAQRLNASGVTQWTPGGVALCTAVNPQFLPKIAPDNAGGAIVTWRDYRGFADVYAQRVSGAGVPLWTADGVGICTLPGSENYPTIVADGAGGAIIAWADGRNGGLWDIYSQRVNAVGAALWTANGVAVCTAPDNQGIDVGASLAADGFGGAVMAWHDGRSGTANHIYVQRLRNDGVPLWTPNGVPVCIAANAHGYPAVLVEASGGAFVVWHDGRSGGTDIYAQRLNSVGTPQWISDGVPVCDEPGNQFFPVIVADNAGGAIVVWDDQRTGNDEVYAQRFELRHGYLGRPEPALVSVADIPADQGGKVKLNWKASGGDVLNQQSITHYSVWRATDAAALASAGEGMAVRDPSVITKDFAGRAMWTQRLEETDYYWEWVGNQTAHYWPAYTFSAPTRSDSTSAGPADGHFIISAHTSDAFVFFNSNSQSGHSVDNLAPPAPLFLTAHRVGYNVHLKWNRSVVPDLRDYSVYRAGSAGVAPVPVNFRSSTDDTVLVDASAPVTALYYIVVATDVHENRSTPSNEASLARLTGAGDTPSVTSLTVLQNYPNPFSGRTEVGVGLPASADVQIDVFDVAGRRVHAQKLSNVPAGWRTVAFAGQDERGKPLASGVYFLRVSAAGDAVTRKIVIAR